MQHTHKWYLPDDTLPNGCPCFVAAISNQGLRENYVFGSGALGRGYYHVLTKTAHRLIYARFCSSSSPLVALLPCFSWFFGGGREAAMTRDKVEEILHARTMNDVERPNDEEAGRIQAKAYYDRLSEEAVQTAFAIAL